MVGLDRRCGRTGTRPDASWAGCARPRPTPPSRAPHAHAHPRGGRQGRLGPTWGGSPSPPALVVTQPAGAPAMLCQLGTLEAWLSRTARDRRTARPSRPNRLGLALATRASCDPRATGSPWTIRHLGWPNTPQRTGIEPGFRVGGLVNPALRTSELTTTRLPGPHPASRERVAGRGTDHGNLEATRA